MEYTVQYLIRDQRLDAPVLLSDSKDRPGCTI
uniref:Uncharacterized protein n=1 Tax=Arundo donax TaxID=35708 RepID=A0A0A8XQR5_ARUDO